MYGVNSHDNIYNDGDDAHHMISGVEVDGGQTNEG